MPALSQMFRSHADSHARPCFVTGYSGSEKVAAGHPRLDLGDREECRQYDGPDVNCAHAVYVVELEPLHQPSIHKCRMRRGKPDTGAPHSAGRRFVDLRQRAHQYTRPFEIDAIKRATERV